MTEIAIVLTIAAMSAISLYAVSLVKQEEVPVMRATEKSVLYFFSLLLLPVLGYVLQVLVDNNANFSGMSPLAGILNVITVVIVFIIMIMYFKVLLFKIKEAKRNG